MSGYRYDTVTDEQPRNNRWLMAAILLVGLGTAAFGIIFNKALKPPRTTSQLIGKQAPPIRAEGWLNGPAPTDEDLKGKVLVLDAWAHWCGPCRAAAPELSALEEKYRSRGVIFIGLTSEGEADLDASRKFIEATRITWPNGYGANETLAALRADFIPQLWIVDRQNRIVWDAHSREPIEEVLERALAESP